jgi:hypothetical protein
MEKVFKTALDMGFDPTQAIVVYKILDTIQMIIFFFLIGIVARWIFKKFKED